MIARVAPEDKPAIEELLKKYNIDNDRYSAIRKSSIACVALPTCGLALAESERYLPRLITLIEEFAQSYGMLPFSPSSLPSSSDSFF
jgi:sulfite reductase (NADPH) hemoprotein beta-component